MASNALQQARKILGTVPSPSPKKEAVPQSKSPALVRWEWIQIGWRVSARGDTGIVVDKFITAGGMPQLWVCWDGSPTPDLPYPEMPLLMEVIQQQQEVA